MNVTHRHTATSLRPGTRSGSRVYLALTLVAFDQGLAPAALVVCTLHLYVTPFLSFLTRIGPAPVLAAVLVGPLRVGLHFAVVNRIGAPPLLLSLKESLTLPPFFAAALVDPGFAGGLYTGAGGAGGTGGAVGMTGSDSAEAADVPPGLVAVAVNAYVVPFVKPPTTQEDAGTVIVQVAPPGDAVTRYVDGLPPEPGVTVTVP